MSTLSPCNTGKSLTFALDWLELRLIPHVASMTFPDEVEQIIVSLIGGEFIPSRAKKLTGYRVTRWHSRSVWLGLHPETCFAGSDHHVAVRLPGGFLKSKPHHVLVALLQRLSAIATIKARRVDLAFDQAHVTPAQLHAAVLADNVRTAVHRERVAPFPRIHLWQQNVYGNTLYLGSTHADRRLRIYDQRGDTRIELQLRHDYADRVVDSFTRIGWDLDQMAELARSYVLDFADFRVRLNPKRNRWGDRLPGWNEFACGSVAAKPPTLPKVKSIENQRAAVWRNARSLAFVAELDAARYGGRDEFLRALVDEGRKRLTADDWQRIAELRGMRVVQQAG